MSDPVKPRGSRTRATRRKITDTATELFVLDGYSATTLERIASRAGVAVQTVYFHFGNKSGVLREAVDVAAVGDDQPVAMLDRPWLEQARAEPDPYERWRPSPSCAPCPGSTCTSRSPLGAGPHSSGSDSSSTRSPTRCCGSGVVERLSLRAVDPLHPEKHDVRAASDGLVGGNTDALSASHHRSATP
jgi:AcrR family transcriptional regulator